MRTKYTEIWLFYQWKPAKIDVWIISKVCAENNLDSRITQWTTYRVTSLLHGNSKPVLLRIISSYSG